MESAAKRRKSQKHGHFYCYRLPRSRSFSTSGSLHDTLGPLTPRHRHYAADARPWVKDLVLSQYIPGDDATKTDRDLPYPTRASAFYL